MITLRQTLSMFFAPRCISPTTTLLRIAAAPTPPVSILPIRAGPSQALLHIARCKRVRWAPMRLLIDRSDPVRTHFSTKNPDKVSIDGGMRHKPKKPQDTAVSTKEQWMNEDEVQIDASTWCQRCLTDSSGRAMGGPATQKTVVGCSAEMTPCSASSVSLGAVSLPSQARQPACIGHPRHVRSRVDCGLLHG